MLSFTSFCVCIWLVSQFIHLSIVIFLCFLSVFKSYAFMANIPHIFCVADPHPWATTMTPTPVWWACWRTCTRMVTTRWSDRCRKPFTSRRTSRTVATWACDAARCRPWRVLRNECLDCGNRRRSGGGISEQKLDQSALGWGVCLFVLFVSLLNV